MTNGIYTILLLIMSNVFMTFAWYGHLRLQQSGISSNWPLYLVIAFSWMIAFFEYCCQVPANRIGFIDNGGPFNLVQLKVQAYIDPWNYSQTLAERLPNDATLFTNAQRSFQWNSIFSISGRPLRKACPSSFEIVLPLWLHSSISPAIFRTVK